MKKPAAFAGRLRFPRIGLSQVGTLMGRNKVTTNRDSVMVDPDHVTRLQKGKVYGQRILNRASQYDQVN